MYPLRDVVLRRRVWLAALTTCETPMNGVRVLRWRDPEF